MEHDVVGELFEQVLSLASRRELLSQEHFSVDGHRKRVIAPKMRTMSLQADRDAMRRRIFMEKNAVIPLMNPKQIAMLEWRRRDRERKRS